MEEYLITSKNTLIKLQPRFMTQTPTVVSKFKPLNRKKEELYSLLISYFGKTSTFNDLHLAFHILLKCAELGLPGQTEGVLPVLPRT